MSNPRERSKAVIADRFFAGESIGDLCMDYDEDTDFVGAAIRDEHSKLRAKLEGLVKEWREGEKELDHGNPYDSAAADELHNCADDLERVLGGGE